MKYYKLWVAALFLKVVGSSWDASYHFKFFFEKYSIPHLVNFSGFLLGAFLLVQEYFHPRYLTLSSRIWITIGYILFLIGIPLDFTYHLLRGLDLTTWSPTHFVYYIATGVMIYGIWSGYFHYEPSQPRWKSLHTVWAFFMVEVLLFPCLQQENGAISLFEYLHHQSIASKEILDLIKDPKSQIFGGVPDWVYPVYGSSIIILMSVILKRFLSDMRIAIGGVSFYIGYRYVAKFILAAANYPTSYVPVMAVSIPIVVYMYRKNNLISYMLSGLCYFIILSLIQQFSIAVTPPVSWEMYLLVFVGNIAAYYLGKLVIYLYENFSFREEEAIV